MKQGKLYFRIVEILLLAAIVFYLGYAIFSAVSDPLTTATVIEYETGEAYMAEGYVARAETVLSSNFPITVPTRTGGEKVAAGGTVAEGYTDASAQERQEQIAALEAQLDQLQYAAGTGLTTADAGRLDEEIFAAMTAFSKAAAQRDGSAIRAQSGVLKGLVVQRDIALGASRDDAVQNQVDALEAQLSSLRSQKGGAARIITTPTAGWYGAGTDGYEAVLTPAALSAITVSQFDAIAPGDALGFGRIITNSTWYYVAKVPSSLAQSLSTGDRLHVRFSGYLTETLSMRVETISAPDGGSRVLVLSSEQFLQEIAALRRASAELIFASYSGLRVPKDAIRYQDGVAGVYVLEGAEANWKPVEILYDNGESFVVAQDKSDVNNLWAGDKVIVDAKNLYDGKVVG